MNDDQFMKLWKYMHDQSEETRAQFAELNARIDGLYTMLDVVVKQDDIDETEAAADEARIVRIADTVEDHEARISTLETRAV